MARRRQLDALGRARFDRLKRMTEVAFGAFERYCFANFHLHFRFVARDAAHRARLLAPRLSELGEEFRAGLSGLAGLVADQTALRALAERFFNGAENSARIIIVVAHVSLMVERHGRLGLLAGFLRRLGRIEFSVDDLAVEP